MLDHGVVRTGMGASDAHELLGDEPGSARTLVYVGAGKDVPGGFSRDDVIGAIRAHRAITTNTPFIDMTIDDHMIGDTVTDTSPSVTVNLRVRAPSWGPVDHLVVYTNLGAKVADMAIPSTSGTDFSTTVVVPVSQDAWIVAEVTGSANMFPVASATEFPPLDVSVIINALSAGPSTGSLNLSGLPVTAKLQPQRLHFPKPYAITNPIWIDHDGDGKFPAPLPALARTVRTQTHPDVRSQFAALPEWTP